MKITLKHAALILGMVVSWSIYYTASKVVVGITGSPYLTGFLLRTAALIFLTIQLISNKHFRMLFHPGKALLLLILIGVFGFLLDLFANLGYASGSLSTGTALLKTDVLMVNLATVIFYKKKLYVSDWIGTLVMLLGVLMVLGVSLSHLTLQASDLFFLASALCVSANAFIIKGVQEKYHVDTDMISYYNNFVVLLLFTSCLPITGDLALIPKHPGITFFLLVLLGGLAQTGIYFFYYRNLKHFDVWIVKLFLLLMPVLSCFIGMIFLHEELSAEKLIGIFIVLAGALIILLRTKLHPGTLT